MSYSATVYTHLDEGIRRVDAYDIDNGLTYHFSDSDSSGQTTDYPITGNIRFTAQVYSGYSFVRWVYREGSPTGTVKYSTANPFTYRGGEDIYIRAETEEDSSSGGSEEWEAVLDDLGSISTEEVESVYLDPYTLYRIEFTPKYSGTLTAYTESDLDTMGFLSTSIWWDSEEGEPTSPVADDDDSGSGNNFELSYEVEAGETYYLWVRCYDPDDEGDVDIVIIPPESTVPDWTLESYDGGLLSSDYGRILNVEEYTLYAISFACEYAGTVTIYSTGNLDVRAWLGQSMVWDDVNGTPDRFLVDNDDYGGDSNFRITYEVAAGESFVLWVRAYNGAATGETTVWIEPPAEPVVEPGGCIYIYSVSEGWVKYVPYVYESGTWRLCTANLYIGNVWEQGT